jgi:CDGSH-type Zn-finger protein
MSDVTITPSEDGPYIVSGPAVLTAPDGRASEHPDPVSICRCGGSSNKPFCDGTHATIDFDRHPRELMEQRTTRVGTAPGPGLTQPPPAWTSRTAPVRASRRRTTRHA